MPLEVPWGVISVAAAVSILLLSAALLRRRKGVKVSISPSSQSGAPGKRLSYAVTVENMENKKNTYDLQISGGDGWSPKLTDNSLSIAANEAKTTTLRVTVPREGGSVILKVTATSRADPSMSDSASCTATAGKSQESSSR